MKTNRWLVLLAAFALIATACAQGGEGGDDDGDTGDDGATSSTTQATTTTTQASGDDDMSDDGGAAEVMTDGVTVTEEACPGESEGGCIYVGMLADLSGVFATLVKDIVDAELYTFAEYNEAGGVGGAYKVEVLVEDTGYDVTAHGEKYDELSDQVVAFTQSTGSPHTASIVDRLTEDNLFAIPLSWYSGWAFQDNVLEQGPNYCIESMSGVEFHTERFRSENDGADPNWAVISLPGEYGQDGAAGAKYAIDQLGLNLVYDAEGLAAGSGNTEVIQGLVDAENSDGVDLVWVTLTPGGLGEIFGGALQQGVVAEWGGSGPSFNFALLDTAIGDALAASYFHSGYYAPYGTDVEGMDELVRIMNEYDPQRTLTDAFTRGYIEAQIMIAVLEAAYAAGDLTPAGVTDAALNLEAVDFGGLIPGGSQTWSGEPNDFVLRAIQIYKPVANWEANTIESGEGLAFEPIDTNYLGTLAADFDFTEPCFVPGG